MSFAVYLKQKDLAEFIARLAEGQGKVSDAKFIFNK